MSTNAIIQAIDEEISRLKHVKALLSGGGVGNGRKLSGDRRDNGGTMSAEGRKRISDAQKRRWAKVKGNK